MSKTFLGPLKISDARHLESIHPSVFVNFLFDIFLCCFDSYGVHSAIWVVAYGGRYFAVPSDVFLSWEPASEYVTNAATL
jgi:hypothetical protein